MTKNILGLKLPTDPRWVDMAEMRIEDILTDHAYCEQKAASTCISLITQFPTHELLVEKLSPLVTEEWGHFRMVLRELKKRKLTLGRQRKDQYVNALMKLQRTGGREDDRLVDKLLIFALIEARSCERFRLLSLNIKDPELQRFYHDLMIAEAGHYRLFIDLANTVQPLKTVRQRWKEFLAEEVKILENIEVRGDRIH